MVTILFEARHVRTTSPLGTGVILEQQQLRRSCTSRRRNS